MGLEAACMIPNPVLGTPSLPGESPIVPLGVLDETPRIPD